MVNRTFWHRKAVFVTGHTGFMGGWLSTWLLELGAQVIGYALKPETEPSYFSLCGFEDRMRSVIGDVCEKNEVRRAMQTNKPEIVFHLAAQPIVRRSYREPVETFATNIIGTVHLLEAIRHTPSVRAVVIVTSDKCYENREGARGYREDDPMGGHDPYSASKGCAELVVAAYRRSFFETSDPPVAVATARAGNVIGGGDWAEDRLVPDAVRALSAGQEIPIRNPRSVRPWQHVLEPLAGYLMLAERLYGLEGTWTGAWNFGPREKDVVTVASLSDMILRHWGCGNWRDVSEQKAPHEAHFLKLDCTKSHQILGWRPCLTLEEAVEMTVVWYRKAFSAGKVGEMYEVTCEQIRNYEARMKDIQK